MPAKPQLCLNSLNSDQIKNICRKLIPEGIEQIRLTGGEPTLRNDLLDVINKLSELPIQKLGLTSNGILLKPLLEQMKQTKCTHLNVSLDSLNKKNYHKITGKDHLDDVLKTVERAKELDFKIKINVVMLKNINSKELFDFIDFSSKNNVEVRFLELMKIGIARENFDQNHISCQELIDKIGDRFKLIEIEKPIDSTSFNYQLDNGANIGFIASESKPFCHNCSRLRLSADGLLRPCLMLEAGTNIAEMNQSQIKATLSSFLNIKPQNRIEQCPEQMHQIGG